MERGRVSGRGSRCNPGLRNIQLLNESLDLDGAMIDVVNEVVKGKEPMPAMTIPMMIGFPLQPGSQGKLYHQWLSSFLLAPARTALLGKL